MKEVQQALEEYQEALEEYPEVLSAWARFKNILPNRYALFKVDTLPMLSFFASKSRVLPMRSLQTNFATSY
jgi:hypothetical protein